LKRAEFKTPTLFEMETADPYDPSRRYIGLLELRGIEWKWKLIELRVRLLDDVEPYAGA
jgi:hypothetical protein